MKNTKQRKRGRPETRVIKLDATPEQVAQRIFQNAKPSDPTLRKRKPSKPK